MMWSGQWKPVQIIALLSPGWVICHSSSVYSSVKWGWNSAVLTLLLLRFTVNILFISHKWNEWEPWNTCDMTTVSSLSVWKASCIIAGAVLHACLTATSQGISPHMPWKHLVLLLCAWLVWVSEGRYRKESWKPWAGWCSVLRSGTGRHKRLHLQTLFLEKLPEPCTPFFSPWEVCLNALTPASIPVLLSLLLQRPQCFCSTEFTAPLCAVHGCCRLTLLVPNAYVIHRQCHHQPGCSRGSSFPW